MSIELSAALQSLKISLEKSSVFGTLDTATPTTTTAAGTWYPIAGTFTNSPLENFELNVDKLKYKGTETRTFKIILNVSASTDTAATTVDIGIGIDGADPSERLVTDRLIKLTTDIGSWVTQGEVTLSTNQEVQLMVLSDKAGAEIEFTKVQANIFPVTHITE